MLSAQVYDVIAATQCAIDQAQPATVDAVRAGLPLLCFSEDMRQQSQTLKQFLLHQLYRHPKVMQTTMQARQVIADLFSIYAQSPQEMQAGFAAQAQAVQGTTKPTHVKLRVVADYIAGMTDRFASREHERLTGQKLLS
jgi:dGTPase